jgi:hypothetical protein
MRVWLSTFIEKAVMSTTAIVIISVVIAHFVIGIGWLVYKMNKK